MSKQAFSILRSRSRDELWRASVSYPEFFDWMLFRRIRSQIVALVRRRNARQPSLLALTRADAGLAYEQSWP